MPLTRMRGEPETAYSVSLLSQNASSPTPPTSVTLPICTTCQVVSAFSNPTQGQSVIGVASS